jgi:hypothetical protein
MSRRRCTPILYLALVSVESLFLLACAIWVLSHLDYNSLSDRRSEAYQLLSYGCLAIFVTLILEYFAMDSVLSESIFQFWASFAVSVLICCLVVVHTFVGQAFSKLFAIMSFVVCTFQVLFFALAKPVHTDLAFRVFKRIGANLVMKEMLRTQQIFFTFLKLDFAIFALTFLFAGLLLENLSFRLYLIISAAVFSAIWFAFALVAVRFSFFRRIECLRFPRKLIG